MIIRFDKEQEIKGVECLKGFKLKDFVHIYLDVNKLQRKFYKFISTLLLLIFVTTVLIGYINSDSPQSLVAIPVCILIGFFGSLISEYNSCTKANYKYVKNKLHEFRDRDFCYVDWHSFFLSSSFDNERNEKGFVFFEYFLKRVVKEYEITKYTNELEN